MYEGSFLKVFVEVVYLAVSEQLTPISGLAIRKQGPARGAEIEPTTLLSL